MAGNVPGSTAVCEQEKSGTQRGFERINPASAKATAGSARIYRI
jgi:hypothetical protein